MNKVYLVVGCPSSGKTWVCSQLKQKFDHVQHDDFIGSNGPAYLNEIVRRSKTSKAPLLIESPFSISQIKEPLEQSGLSVECVFIQENEDTLKQRYEARGNGPIPKGHLTRQKTYSERAREYGSYSGTSQQVLDYLKSK